jgi:hypothetical protein
MPEGVGYGPQNTTSVGLNLNIIGNHCYAFSGMFSPATSAYTMLEFTTGSELAKVKLTVSGAIDNADPEQGGVSVFTLAINNQEITRLKVDTSLEDMPTLAVIPLLLEPYSKIKLTAIDSVTVTTRKTSALIVGKIYK